MSFEQDILSRDTNLFPIVEINESIYISTNSVTLNGQYYKQLLLNVPSLKESIDLEKRNYKISNVTLNISNYEHEGVRFSEMVADTSLINQSVNISWVSPTGQKLIYQGQVRRYEHDDEKVKLTVEDNTQAVLNQTLPIEDLEDNPEVPESYKHKPIPLVFGQVDKSPCVVSSTPFSEDETSNADTILKVDSDNDVIVNELYVFMEDSFILAPRQITQPLSEFDYSEGSQWEDEGNEIIFEELTGSMGDEGTVTGGTSAVSNNNLILYKKAYSNEITPQQNGNIIIAELWDGANSTVVRDDENKPIVSGTVSKGDWSEQNTSESFAVANGFDADGTDNVPELDEEYDYIQVSCTLSMDIQLSSSSSGIIQDQGYMYADYQIGTSALVNVPYALNVLVRAGGNQNNDFVSGLYETSFYWENDGNGFNDGGYSANNPLYHNANIISSDKLKRWDELGFYVTVRRVEATQYNGEMGALIKFNDVYIDYYAEAEKLHTLSFYADVNGRGHNEILIDTPYAQNHFDHILYLIGLTSEDHNLFADTNLYFWRNDFTVSETITAKKLIEEIAKVSPYIPRFANDGKFKVDVIKDRYGDDDINNEEKRTLIQESDCIKWSYSKTKIEDVYSEIKLNYKKNYARDDYDGYFKMNVKELDQFVIDDTYFEYYGIKSDHLDSTLEIESDYIRNEDTAKEYVKWLLYWHCNSHLKVKVKLPLKYLNVEVGSLLTFDKVLGGVKPYGIDYKQAATFKLTVDGDEIEYLGDFVNFSQAYPLFMCISTNKTLEYIELECIQLHKLSDEE